MATQSQLYGSPVSLLDPIPAIANSATVGYQTDKVILKSISPCPIDVEVNVVMAMANTAPANDAAVHLYACPFYNTTGSTYVAADGGTATPPSGSAGACTIANPNNLVPLGDLKYTTTQQTVQGSFRLGERFSTMPDAFSVVAINFSGAASISTGSAATYTPINFSIA